MKYLILITLIVACSSKPQLYPNDKYKSVGKDVAQSDVKICMDESEEFLKGTKGKQVAKGAGGGAAIGAAIGAVGGLFTGNFGGGLVRGGAIGAAAGGTGAAISPDQLKKNYVNQCLADKGYRVIGWD